MQRNASVINILCNSETLPCMLQFQKCLRSENITPCWVYFLCLPRKYAYNTRRHNDQQDIYKACVNMYDTYALSSQLSDRKSLFIISSKSHNDPVRVVLHKKAATNRKNIQR